MCRTEARVLVLISELTTPPPAADRHAVLLARHQADGDEQDGHVDSSSSFIAETVTGGSSSPGWSVNSSPKPR